MHMYVKSNEVQKKKKTHLFGSKQYLLFNIKLSETWNPICNAISNILYELELNNKEYLKIKSTLLHNNYSVGNRTWGPFFVHGLRSYLDFTVDNFTNEHVIWELIQANRLCKSLIFFLCLCITR